MDEKKLMIFLQKILESGSESKSKHTLCQLREILTEQKVPHNLIRYVDIAINSLPEVKAIAKTHIIDKEQIGIAKERADARKRRELEMTRYRGCR